MRRWLVILVIIIAIVMAGVTAAARRSPAHTNDFILLFLLELLAIIVGGVIAGVALARRRDLAAGALAIGLYLLVVAAAVGTVLPIWLPSDNTILGAALLAGLLAAVSTGLALVGAGGLRGISPPALAITCLGGVVLAFLAVTAGGTVAPLARLRLPIIVAALVGLAVLSVAWRHRPLVALPLAVAAIGMIVTIATLVARGAGDWASGSTSIKLYSFPIVVMAFAFSLLILDSQPRGRPPEPPPA
jgi:hypothetical protein